MTGARVLVVDDEEALCCVLKDTLEMEGCEVEVCQNGQSAHESLARSSFDVALVDVFLSDGPSGLALGRQILSNYPQTSLVLVTGFAEEADIRAGYASGAYTCIRKPFILDDVIRVVRKAMDERPGAPPARRVD